MGGRWSGRGGALSRKWAEFPGSFCNPDVHAPSVTLSNHTELGNQPYNDHGSQDRLVPVLTKSV